MVRKGITNARARRGILPSDPFKDRAHTVHYLIRTFESYFAKTERDSMANFAKEILVVGDAGLLFSGKDPFISGVAIFVYVCRRFSPDGKCVVTYDDIRTTVAHFSSGASFVSMLKTLKKRFG